jgi:hypothetical protein
MDAIGLLRNRIGAIGAMTQDRIRESAGVDWVKPLLPGTSPLGLTLWHMPRTVDWLVSTSARGVPEVAEGAPFSELPDPRAFGFGTGLSPEQASEAAAQVTPEPLLAYSEAVHAMADEWLAGLTAEDLDAPVPEFLERQQAHPAYGTEAALSEVTGLIGQPLGLLLARPTMSHLLVHLGETELILQLAR